MAAESILTYKKPGFPRKSLGPKGYTTTIEYVGPTATLEAAVPAIGAAWGDYIGVVDKSDIEQLPGTTTSDLQVVVSYEFSSTDSTFGEAREINYEIEWNESQPSMFEHPQFRIGGGGANELSKQDIVDIEAWQNEQDTTLREAFKYNAARPDEVPDETELTANAKLFATGILNAVDYFPDYIPVARKTTTYVNGPPNTSTAGAKETPSGFPNLPTGYEWRKSADRSIRAGGQNRWERTEEWTGAIKVLVDKNQVYWTTPT